MRSLALLGAIVIDLAGTGYSLAASAPRQHGSPSYTPRHVLQHDLAESRVSAVARSLFAPHFIPLQTGPTATVTAGAQSTATPGPSPTATTYPDPTVILQNMFAVYQKVKTARFELVIDGAQAPNIEKLHIVAVGDATCKGFSMKGHYAAKDVRGTPSQTHAASANFAQIKKKAWLKAKSTHGRWARTKNGTIQIFGFLVANPLLCSTGSTGAGGTSSGSDVLKDVKNLGPGSFKGDSVWHIQATDVSTDAQGQTSEATLDFLVSQSRFLPYVFAVSVDDTVHNVTVSQQQILTKFGEKVTVKAPKVGSSKG